MFFTPLLLSNQCPFAISTDSDIENDLDVSLDMDKLSLLLTGMASMSEQAFLGFPMRGKYSVWDFFGVVISMQRRLTT